VPYLLDSNVLIDADRDYYPIERVPEFWGWLVHQSTRGIILTPTEMYNEVVAGKGALVDWLKTHKGALVLKDEADPTLVRDVVSQGYAPDLTEDELEKVGNDPFIDGLELKWEYGDDFLKDLIPASINVRKLLKENGLDSVSGWHIIKVSLSGDGRYYDFTDAEHNLAIPREYFQCEKE